MFLGIIGTRVIPRLLHTGVDTDSENRDRITESAMPSIEQAVIILNNIIGLKKESCVLNFNRFNLCKLVRLAYPEIGFDEKEIYKYTIEELEAFIVKIQEIA